MVKPSAVPLPSISVNELPEVWMVYRRTDHVAWRTLGNETVVVDLSANRMYGLNESGGRVWEALGEEADPESLVGRLGLTGEDIERNLLPIRDFLTELSAAGLVEAESDTAVEDGMDSAPRREEGRDPAAPKIVFSEEIRNFGQSTNMICFQDPKCDQGCG